MISPQNITDFIYMKILVSFELTTRFDDRASREFSNSRPFV